MKFDNKVVIVTGGSGAVGSVVVQKFASKGARIFIADRVPPRDEDVKLLGKLNENVTFVKTDVLNEQSIKALFAKAHSIGHVDVLVNVAGGFQFGPTVEDMDVSQWDALIELNLKSAFLAIKNVIPIMKMQNYGRIISIAARSGLRGDPMVAHYSVSKGGIILLSQSVAEEIKDFDITVNTVLPSIVDTPANRVSMSDANYGKWVNPFDLANVILFLASDDARAISGASIPVYHKS